MPTPMNVFVTEHNVDIYLSQLQVAQDDQSRDNLMRLLVEEFKTMGVSHDHLDMADRHIRDGRKSILVQREFVEALPVETRATHPSTFSLASLEAAQSLLEAHARHLRNDLERNRANSVQKP